MSKTTKENLEILSELRWIYANYPHFRLLQNVKRISVCNSTIGQNLGHFKPSNYTALFDKAIEDETYVILLKDDSIINFYYIFDGSGKITGHNLMYIPNPYEDNGRRDIAYAKYIRIDYDQNGYEKVVHTQIHLHTSIYSTGFRIPVAHYISPKDFLYIVLKYVYHSEEAIVDKLIVKRNRTHILASEEQDKLRILFGDSVIT